MLEELFGHGVRDRRSVHARGCSASKPRNVRCEINTHPTTGQPKPPFLQTLQGRITTTAGFVVGVTSLVGALTNFFGLFGNGEPVTPDPKEEAAVTQPKVPGVEVGGSTQGSKSSNANANSGELSPKGVTGDTCSGSDTFDARITVAPETAAKGEQVVVTGSGYCPNDRINFAVHLASAGHTIANSSGGFTYEMTVPQNGPSSGFPAGIHAISDTGRGNDRAEFTVG